jgi:hypothetical protein
VVVPVKSDEVQAVLGQLREDERVDGFDGNLIALRTVFVLNVGRLLRLRFKPDSDAGRFSRAFEGVPLLLFEQLIDECGLNNLAKYKMTKAKLPSIKVRVVVEAPGTLDPVF